MNAPRVGDATTALCSPGTPVPDSPRRPEERTPIEEPNAGPPMVDPEPKKLPRIDPDPEELPALDPPLAPKEQKSA